MELADLDRVGAGALRVRHGGRVGELPHPADLSWERVVVALASVEHFMVVVVPPGARVSYMVAERLAGAWRRHHDLPDYDDARRLTYLLNRYHDDLEIDLPQLGDLWRARRWRYLLNLVDHLPRTSWYARAVALDGEAAKVIAQRHAAQGSDQAVGQRRVPIEHWTPEVEYLVSILNELKAQRAEFIAANSQKGSNPPQPNFVGGPETALEKEMEAAKLQIRKERHARISAMLTPLAARTPQTATLTGAEHADRED